MAQELNTAALPTEHQHGSPLSTHSSSSGDEEEFGLFQALPVADVRIEDLAWEYLPQSVEEYLARVRHEAKRLPDVVTSHIDPRTFDARRTAAVPVEAHSTEWSIQKAVLLKTLVEFLDVRLKLQQALLQEGRPKLGFPLPPRQDSAAWKSFCLQNPDGEAAADPHSSSAALLLLAIDQGAVNRLLRWQVSWVLEDPSLFLQCSRVCRNDVGAKTATQPHTNDPSPLADSGSF
ncbi:hypothetical protein WJX84_006025 [Apatococcus fuscideae]|uniref:Uncharacterized protein n=1 Tax=Apatococcus fuscideae TaxID=2026836 RepID=A0AAW1T600_9CHLO